MKFQDYQTGTTRTFKPHEPLTAKQAEILDWAIGLPGEVGEVVELVKHSIFHKEPMNKVKLAKEIGDVLWYISALSKSYDIPLDAAAELNLAKLEHRHGQKFSFEKSADRHQREEKFEETSRFEEIVSKIQAGE